MMLPRAHLHMLPLDQPIAASQPASKLGNGGRLAHGAPMSEPITVPRQAPMTLPTSGTGSAVRTIPPTREVFLYRPSSM